MRFVKWNVEWTFAGQDYKINWPAVFILTITFGTVGILQWLGYLH